MHFMIFAAESTCVFGCADIGAVASSLNCTLETPTLSKVLAESVAAVPLHCGDVVGGVGPCNGTVTYRESVLLVSFDSAKRLLVSA